ncbi:hypothetical protein COW81_01210 [Candidatus Campbellbacteria bacterium CG22_combo_CG10-13_8_21_14_all_36_13]|uniref:GlxA-like beta barrel domain-containing protein n=1 Tax=Candidatus Campbellbacteria bacterium CG22_combo_CG10-13_8_21_14_all_36_13 TaxID=1974529 RepID=A0A2H0DYK6_9BACT|nr:MAG: hypothetical protein COW81_01210 [Candidatus Campbellbacteria bacterium CG22_combo_CG10-13_8_21_14_all_36_13]
MKKIQDIISSSKKSIRDISIERNGSRPQRRPSGIPENVVYSSSRGGGPSFGIWFIAILAIIFLFFSFTIIFSGTKVVVTQKTESLSFETNFDAVKSSDDPEALIFDVMSISESANKTVVSTGQEQKESKALGTIIVYNDYSTSPQKLIANTRFETPDGLIYRIKDAVVVPGKTKGSDGKYIPGSLEVVVYADVAGEKYNKANSDFVIPGLKGSSQYTSFYARSKTPLAGGFVGLVNKVTEADRLAALDSIKTSLQASLMKSIKTQVPEGYVLFDDAVKIDFTEGQDVALGDNKVQIVVNGKLDAVVFNKDAVSRKIAQVQLDPYDGLPVEGIGVESLLFVLDKKNDINLTSVESISFSLKGNMTLVWKFDEEALKADLVDKKKRDIDWVLAEYPSIVEAQIVMRPFWKRNFPSDTKKINIVYNSVD